MTKSSSRCSTVCSAAGKEAATQPVGDVTEMQVDARRLDRRFREPIAIPADEARADRLVEPLRGQHPGPRHRERRHRVGPYRAVRAGSVVGGPPGGALVVDLNDVAFRRGRFEREEGPSIEMTTWST